MNPINNIKHCAQSTEKELADGAKLQGRHVQRRRSFTIEGGQAQQTVAKTASTASTAFVAIEDDLNQLEKLRTAVINDYTDFVQLSKDKVNPKVLLKLEIINDTMMNHMLTLEICKNNYSDNENIKSLMDIIEGHLMMFFTAYQKISNDSDVQDAEIDRKHVSEMADDCLFEKLELTRQSKNLNAKNRVVEIRKLGAELDARVKIEKSTNAFKTKYEGLQSWTMTKLLELKHTHDQQDLEYMSKEVSVQQREIDPVEWTIIRKAYPDIKGNKSEEYNESIAAVTLLDELKRKILSKLASVSWMAKISEEHHTHALKAKYELLLDWIISKKVEAQHADNAEVLNEVLNEVIGKEFEISRIDEEIVKAAYFIRSDFDSDETRTIAFVTQGIQNLKSYIRNKLTKLTKSTN